MSMQNFRRRIGLIVADAGGQALDLSGFRVVFTVEKTAAEEPNTAKIDISNLSDTTSARLTTGELTRIILQAGYEGRVSVLFDGQITAATRTRDGADFTTALDAGDGAKAYTYAVVSQSLASGYSQADVARAASAAMSGKGTRGEDLVAVDSATKFPRGRVIFRSARDAARDIARSSECQWSIQDGRVVFCRTKKVLGESQGFLLSPASGMIGSPVVDADGVTVRCCLNPALKIYDPIRIESRYVKGTYKILSVKHTGDTHGADWTTELKCVALDPTTGEAKK